MEEDKRQHKRFVVEGVHGSMLFASSIDILNISMGGAAIETARRLNIGSDYTMKFEDRGNSISLRCTVRWAMIVEGRKGAHGDVIPIYRAGLEFKDILTEKTVELSYFIEGHKKASEGRLMGVRFKVHTPPGKAVLSFHYTVRKVSMGGMLIEAGQPLSVAETMPMEVHLSEGKIIRFTGRVASCFETKEKLKYNIGIAFEEMSDGDKEGLKEFINILYE